MKQSWRGSCETKRLSACQFLGIIINKQVKAMQKQESEVSIEHADELGDQIRSIGSWSFNQNLLYVIFLQKNKLIMVSKKKRRNLRIFDQMAEFIATRNSLQCRSHHQKLLQKFGEIKNIISNFKKYITKEQYKQKFQQIFSKDKNKQESEDKTYDVKMEPLSQEINQPQLQQPLEKHCQVPLIVQPKFSEFQLVYNQFLAQFSRQLLEYPMMAYCYPPLHNIS